MQQTSGPGELTCATRDRRAKVLASTTVNGIDFVEIANRGADAAARAFPERGQGRRCRRRRHRPSPAARPSRPSPCCRSPPSAWGWDEGHLTLTLTRRGAGRLLDLHADHLRAPGSIRSSTGSRSPSRPAARPTSTARRHARPARPSSGDPPPIEYLAKDFLSFRQALLDFSTLRYPAWQERSEADFGMMFLEALSAVADDLSYTQDRIAAEATLLTATQRRSVIRHARLVDYEATPAGLGAAPGCSSRSPRAIDQHSASAGRHRASRPTARR